MCLHNIILYVHGVPGVCLYVCIHYVESVYGCVLHIHYHCTYTPEKQMLYGNIVFVFRVYSYYLCNKEKRFMLLLQVTFSLSATVIVLHTLPAAPPLVTCATCSKVPTVSVLHCVRRQYTCI